MNASFWWRLRHYWHHPNTVREMSWPEYTCNWLALFYKKDDPFKMDLKELFTYAWWVYRRHPKLIWRDFCTFIKRAWYALLVVQPFHCNGNKGGWRTRLCDSLEQRARKHECEEEQNACSGTDVG